MDKVTKFQDDQKTKPPPEEEEMLEEEKALSLCDFPLNSGEPSEFKTQDNYKRRSSSVPSEFFEFFTDFSSDETMSSADDIIFRGKLVPYFKNQQPTRTHHHQILKSSLSADDATYTGNNILPRRHFELTPRNGRSTDCKKFRRNSTTPLVMKSEASSSEAPKVTSRRRRWFVFMMFGPLKLQQEMDLRDMKNRQLRRNPGKIPAIGNDRRRSSWGHDLIRVLSCKNHASVAVSTSNIITNHNIHI